MKQKICKLCKLEKSLTKCFYKQSKYYNPYCNKCRKIIKSNYVKTHQHNIKKYRKEYYNSDLGKRMLKTYHKSKQYIDYIKNYYIKFPERKMAVQKLNSLLRHGKVIKRPCEICGIKKSVHAHHEDYSKPLEVIWLCPSHHKERHKKLSIKLRNLHMPLCVTRAGKDKQNYGNRRKTNFIASISRVVIR